MEVAGASARACERRVTDGINHRCDRVRGGERGRWAVTDGAERCRWREQGVVVVGFRVFGVGGGGGRSLWMGEIRLIKQTAGGEAAGTERVRSDCWGQTERKR